VKSISLYFFFLGGLAAIHIYILSLHDALPIFCTYISGRSITSDRLGESVEHLEKRHIFMRQFYLSNKVQQSCPTPSLSPTSAARSEEHTSELQSRFDLVCRLLLEKKNCYILKL